MDLSGSGPGPGPAKPEAPKLKVKQHLVDPHLQRRLLKNEEVPEVGSTTTGLEEIQLSAAAAQDFHPHLWHPLFGNTQKCYNSPWNWTTVTVNGE